MDKYSETVIYLSSGEMTKEQLVSILVLAASSLEIEVKIR